MWCMDHLTISNVNSTVSGSYTHISRLWVTHCRKGIQWRWCAGTWISTCQAETYKTWTVKGIRSCRSPYIRFSKCRFCTGHCVSWYITWSIVACSFIGTISLIAITWAIAWWAGRIIPVRCSLLSCCFCCRCLSCCFFLLSLQLFFRRLTLSFFDLLIQIRHLCLLRCDQVIKFRLLWLILCLHTFKLWLFFFQLIFQLRNLLLCLYVLL